MFIHQNARVFLVIILHLFVTRLSISQELLKFIKYVKLKFEEFEEYQDSIDL